MSTLYELAVKKFGNNFTEAEKLLLEKAPLGERINMRPEMTEDILVGIVSVEIMHWVEANNFAKLYQWLENNDNLKLRQWVEANDPAYAEYWSANRIVRAELIQWILRDKKAKNQLMYAGIGLCGVKIDTPIDLNYSTIEHPIQIIYSALESISLLDATTKRLSFIGSHIKGFSADNAEIMQSAIFDKIQSKGKFSLNGANIIGQLECSNASFEFEGNTSFNANSISIKSNAIFDHITSKGAFRLNGAYIGGQLRFSHAILENKKPDNNSEFAFCAEATIVKGSVFFDHVKLIGECRLIGAKIYGSLSCEFASFENQQGYSFDAERTVVMDHANLSNITSIGEFNFSAATIQGSLYLNNSSFINPSGNSFCADRLIIQNHALFNSIYSEGTFRLSSADIRGDLECKNYSIFLCPKGISFNATCLMVSGRADFESVQSDGEFSLANARITGQLELSHACFYHDHDFTLNMQELTVSSGLFMTDNFRIHGMLCLDYAKVRQLVDERDCWPSKGMLRIEGLEYDSFDGTTTPKSSKERLEWLSLMPEDAFYSQPYEHLAKNFREMGHRTSWREVKIAKEIARRKSTSLGFFAILWSYFLGAFVAHGYKPWRALILLFLLWLAGSSIFYYADIFGVLQPAKERLYTHSGYKDGNDWPNRYPKFNSLVYSLDTLIPFLNLHQEDFWLPDATKNANFSPFNTSTGAWIRAYLWFHIIAGWVLASLGAVSLTGIVRKDE